MAEYHSESEPLAAQDGSRQLSDSTHIQSAHLLGAGAAACLQSMPQFTLPGTRSTFTAEKTILGLDTVPGKLTTVQRSVMNGPSLGEELNVSTRRK